MYISVSLFPEETSFFDYYKSIGDYLQQLYDFYKPNTTFVPLTFPRETRWTGQRMFLVYPPA